MSIARLVGVIEHEGEPGACSLVFVLETEEGEIEHLTYGTLMEALKFAGERSILPPLSSSWWSRVSEYDGCSL